MLVHENGQRARSGTEDVGVTLEEGQQQDELPMEPLAEEEVC